MSLSPLSHIESCATAARILRVRLESFTYEYPGFDIVDLVKGAQYLAEELHEMNQTYNPKKPVIKED